MALGEADITAELLSFAGDIALLHSYRSLTFLMDSSANYTRFYFLGQQGLNLVYCNNMDIQVTSIFLFIISLLLAMSFHEATHAFVAHWLGDTTARDEGRLTLNPLKHIDLMTTILLPTVLILVGLPPILAAKPVPFNPNRVRFDEFGAALIGIAGPISNLLLAFAVGSFIRFGDVSLTGTMGEFIYVFISVNIGLFLFNMLPIPPLDGSRLLYAVAPEPVQRVMYRIESAGIFVVLMLLLLLLPLLRPVLNSGFTFFYSLILGL